MVTYRKQGLKTHLLKSMELFKQQNNIVRDVTKMKIPLIMLAFNMIQNDFV